MINNNKKKGFTLIELIAVIAILVILAAVMVPKFMSYTRDSKVAATVSNGRLVMDQIEVYNADTTDDTKLIKTTTDMDVIKGYLTTGTKVYIQPDSWVEAFKKGGKALGNDGTEQGIGTYAEVLTFVAKNAKK